MINCHPPESQIPLPSFVIPLAVHSVRHLGLGLDVIRLVKTLAHFSPSITELSNQLSDPVRRPA
jgi:hypothetical protein